MSFNHDLPAVIGPQPNRWLWLDTAGNTWPCVITKVTAHSDKLNLVWYDASGEEHVEIDARHFSKVPTGTACWVETDGGTGYVPTA